MGCPEGWPRPGWVGDAGYIYRVRYNFGAGRVCVVGWAAAISTGMGGPGQHSTLL